MSYLYGAAEDAVASGKPVYVYYFGDWDLSGLRIEQAIEKDLRGFGLGDMLHFQRVAVTEEQITRWGLRTRPPKPSDTRSKKWGNRPCVDLDAVRPDILRGMVRECIERHVDQEKLADTLIAEREERELFARLVEGRTR